MKRLLLAAVQCLYVLAALPAIVLAGLLVASADTAAGRLFGLGAACMLPVPLMAMIWISSRSRKLLLAATLTLLLAGMAAVGVCYAAAPRGKPPADAGIASRYLGGARYHRASPANLVPETDQLKLGSYVFTTLDPLIDREQARRIRSLFRGVYSEMDRSPEFVSLGSALGFAYSEIFLGQPGTAHFYEYVPPSAAGHGKLPVILFLHGSMGNFKGYMWLWKKFADKYGYAVLAPTFGAGNWNRAGGMQAVDAARLYCNSNPMMDGKRIYLVGLSNGGIGVGRAAAARPRSYKGLVFISPVIEREIVTALPFQEGWRGRHMLVIHGSADDRIAPGHVKGLADEVRAQGAKVQASFYEKEDHFLLFSAWERVSKDVAAWIEMQGP